MIDIAAGIAAATQAIDITKALRGIEKNYDAASYRAQIAELMDALSNAKLALIDAREQAAERDKEIDRLRTTFQAKGELVKGEGDYSYLAGEDGKPLGFPICPSCEAEGRMAQLKQDGPTETAKCPTCNKSYKPVTCYIEGGDTLRAQELRKQAEGFARANAALQGRTRGRNNWIV